jgi:hypothetical protein
MNSGSIAARLFIEWRASKSTAASEFFNVLLVPYTAPVPAMPPGPFSHAIRIEVSFALLDAETKRRVGTSLRICSLPRLRMLVRGFAGRQRLTRNFLFDSAADTEVHNFIQEYGFCSAAEPVCEPHGRSSTLLTPCGKIEKRLTSLRLLLLPQVRPI